MELFYYDHFSYMIGYHFYAYMNGICESIRHAHYEPELVFVLEGDLEVTLGETSYSIREGGMFFVNSGISHAYHAKYGYAICTSMALNLELLAWQLPGVKNMQIDLHVTGYNERSQEIDRLRVLGLALSRNLFNSSDEKRNPLKAQSIGFLILSQLLNHFSSLPYPHSEGPVKELPRDKAMAQYILDHFNQNITLKTLAEEFHLSPYYVSHYFRQTFHESFSQYLTKIRIINARRMLQNEKKSITDVAMECGFNDVSVFSKVFKAQIGMNPSTFRRENFQNTPQFEERRIAEPTDEPASSGPYRTKSGTYIALSPEEITRYEQYALDRLSELAPQQMGIYELYR